MARVQQLERRLPLQSIACQVPIENTHGGFELFSNGTRQLAPEVAGSYGSPGYDVEKGASFFIAGDNFSIKQTHVICGNQYLPAGSVQLISRQILQVDLPAGLPILKDSRLIEHENVLLPDDQRYSGYVDLQVATPYGVSSHLLIPAIQIASPQPSEPKSCPPTTLHTSSEGIESVLVAGANGNYSKLLVRSSMLPPIDLPKDSKVGVASRNVRLYLSNGQDRLAPVLFKDVALSNSNEAYQIGADTFLDSVDEKGTLLKAINHYVGFLESNTLVPPDRKLSLTAQYTVEFDKVEVPVTGSFPIIVQIP
jgi:hypothetical protein